jgi:hypothetical protein
MVVLLALEGQDPWFVVLGPATPDEEEDARRIFSDSIPAVPTV